VEFLEAPTGMQSDGLIHTCSRSTRRPDLVGINFTLSSQASVCKGEQKSATPTTATQELHSGSGIGIHSRDLVVNSGLGFSDLGRGLLGTNSYRGFRWTWRATPLVGQNDHNNTHRPCPHPSTMENLILKVNVRGLMSSSAPKQPPQGDYDAAKRRFDKADKMKRTVCENFSSELKPPVRTRPARRGPSS
jgi:hypothetical protein